MDDSRALGRIAALLRQAEGTDNEHEADAFLQAAQRLATTASIDLAVARAHTGRTQARVAPVQRAVGIGEPGTRGLRTYVELFLAISRANDVTCDIATNSSTVFCYGFADDIDTCEALYASVAVQMVRASDAYLTSGAYRSESVRKVVVHRGRRVWTETPVHGTTARINFQQAYAARIGARLAEAREAARREAVAAEREADPRAPSTGTELVLHGKDVELRDFYRSQSRARGSWRGARATAGFSSHARQAGDRAARRARLGDEKVLDAPRGALRAGRADPGPGAA